MLVTKALEFNITPEGVTIPIYKNTDLKGNLDAVMTVYVTTVGYRRRKGPIVHKRRKSIVSATEGSRAVVEYIDPATHSLVELPLWDERNKPLSVEIPPGIPVLYRNDGHHQSQTAMLIVVADYAWRPNDDESTKYNGWDDPAFVAWQAQQ